MDVQMSRAARIAKSDKYRDLYRDLHRDRHGWWEVEQRRMQLPRCAYFARGHDCMDAGGRVTQERLPRSPKRCTNAAKIPTESSSANY